MSKTAKELLEARYQAFIDHNIDFIVDSTHPETRANHDRKGLEEWAKNAEWLGLDIEDEATEGDKTQITFTVKYREQGSMIHHREIAEFRLHEGDWFYYDSYFPKVPPLRRDTPKIGRNDPCACGSGKKHKKCCGA